MGARGVGYSTGIIHMRHPEAGDLRLHRTRLDVPHSRGAELLLMYTPNLAASQPKRYRHSIPRQLLLEYGSPR